MKKIKKILTTMFVLLGAVLVLTGCGSGSDSDELEVGLLIYKYDDTYISSVRQAIEDIADGSDVKLHTNDGQGDQGTQNDQIDILIERGVDVLAVNIVDIGAADAVIEKAKAADIPVIFFNREPDADVIKSYDKAMFVGTEAKEAGIIQGEMMAELWEENEDLDRNGDGVMQYVMLQGDADNPEAIARTDYSVSTIEDAGIETEELALQVANWDNDKANQAMEAWLDRFGEEIEFVIANNDGMASGAISALQNAGYNTGDSDKYIPVYGVDATEEAQNLIKNGEMEGTVEQDAQGMAKAVFAITENAAGGDDFLEGTDYEYDDTGIAVRIPYKAFK